MPPEGLHVGWRKLVSSGSRFPTYIRPWLYFLHSGGTASCLNHFSMSLRQHISHDHPTSPHGTLHPSRPTALKPRKCRFNSSLATAKAVLRNGKLPQRSGRESKSSGSHSKMGGSNSSPEAFELANAVSWDAKLKVDY
jgi:hypothetical protein